MAPVPDILMKMAGVMIVAGALSAFFCVNVEAVERVQFDRELLIQEFNKEFMQDASYKDGFAQRQQLYEDEAQAVRNQLKVITGPDGNNDIIVPGDELKLSFRDRDKINAAIYKVDGKGNIYLPLIGALRVNAMTSSEAGEVIQHHLQRYIRYPEVTLSINADGRFMVLGAVRQPGVYRLRSNFTLMEGLLLARYRQDKAKLKNIIVMRGPKDKPIVTSLNLYKMLKNGDRSEDIFLKPGDLVLVPTTTVGNIKDFVGNVYQAVLTWYGFGGQDIIEEGDPFIGPIDF